jgi:hypothetical protein
VSDELNADRHGSDHQKRIYGNEFPCGACRSAGPDHEPTCLVLLSREPAVQEERVRRTSVEALAEGFMDLPLEFVKEIADGDELGISAIRYVARKVAEAREEAQRS